MSWCEQIIPTTQLSTKYLVQLNHEYVKKKKRELTLLKFVVLLLFTIQIHHSNALVTHSNLLVHHGVPVSLVTTVVTTLSFSHEAV